MNAELASDDEADAGWQIQKLFATATRWPKAADQQLAKNNPYIASIRVYEII